MGRPVTKTMSSNQNIRVWKSSESTRIRMEESLPNYYEAILQGKGKIHCIIWYTSFIPMLQVMKIPAAKAVVDKEWEKLGKIPVWNLTKVRKVHYASLLDICHLKNAEFETRHQKYKGRVRLRDDIVKDDSGSYAVFTEHQDHQYHKWLQRKSWTSYPDSQAAQDKQLTQYLLKPRSKWKMLENYWNFQNRNVQTLGFVHHDTNSQNHEPVWQIQSFLLNEICMVILWQDCYGKDNLIKSYWCMIGRKFPIGNASSYTVKKDYFFYLCMWMI